VISSVVSTDRNGAITGFAFIKGKTGKSNSKVRELGIFVRDDLRGKRIGSILLKSILRIAKEESISTVYLTVLLENSRAIRLYKRYGFRTINILRNGDEWRRKKMDCAEMSLNLIYNLQPFEVPRKKS
jgi:phosphinothricin acetyltransferase